MIPIGIWDTILRQYLGKDQDTIIVIKIVLGVLKLCKHTKAPEKRLTCKAIYQGANLLRTRPCSNAADILTYTKYHQKKKDVRERDRENSAVIHQGKHTKRNTLLSTTQTRIIKPFCKS